jgi:hypothetical protein
MHTHGMQTSKFFKPIISIAAAGAIAGVVAFLTTFAPGPGANALATMPAPSLAYANAEGQPLPPKGAACSAHGWPDFERSCQFDFRKPANEARTVRIIAIR